MFIILTILTIKKNRFKNNKSFIDNELKVKSKNRKELLGFDIEPIE